MYFGIGRDQRQSYCFQVFVHAHDVGVGMKDTLDTTVHWMRMENASQHFTMLAVVTSDTDEVPARLVHFPREHWNQW